LRAKVAATGAADFALDATRVDVPAERLDRFRALGDNLREALVVSSLYAVGAASSGEADVITAPAPDERCARCWKHIALRTDPRNPELCSACAAIVAALDE
jgi:hypothetical protein